jgi:hypothetical protein
MFFWAIKRPTDERSVGLKVCPNCARQGQLVATGSKRNQKCRLEVVEI